MVIRAWLFILFWTIISFAFLFLGFHALDETELSHSVPPVVMFLFKLSLAVSSCFSSSYALDIQARSTYGAFINLVRSHYVCSSFVFPRAFEAILTWYVLEAIFGWLQFPTVSFLSIFQFPLKMLEDMVHSPPDVVLGSFPVQSISDIQKIAGIVFVGLYSVILAKVFSLVEKKGSPILLTFLGKLDTFLGVVHFVLLFILPYCLLLYFNENFSELEIRAGIMLSLKMSCFLFLSEDNLHSPMLVLCISDLMSLCWAVLSMYGDDTLVTGDLLRDGESMEGLVRSAVKVVASMIKKVLMKLKEHKAMKLIKFGIGALGSLLFQSFFKITSFSEVAAFLCFTVVWLANQVLLGFKADFGIFNFLLLNVVVSCTVGQFGLHGETWLALAAAIFLYAVALILQSIAIPYEQGQQMQFSFFKTNIRELPTTSNPLPPNPNSASPPIPLSSI